MPSLFDINEGARPSTLELGRHATGELELAASRLDAQARAHLDALQRSKARVPTFDIAAIRARAGELQDAPPQAQPTAPVPSPANNWRWFAPLIVLAAVFVLAVLPDPTAFDPTPPTPGLTLKGGGLLVYQLHDDQQLRPYQGNALGEGDSIGFRVNGGDHHTVAVLSVDGRGTVSVLYPDKDENLMQLGGSGETIPLPGTVILDDAPGPEIFVAVFDMPHTDARDALDEAYKAGGTAGVESWVQEHGGADSVRVERR